MPTLQQMPVPARQEVVDVQASFAGGLNTVSDPSALQPNQARQLKNLRLTTFGAAIKRLGTQLVSTAGFAIIPRRALYWPSQNGLVFGGEGSASVYITSGTTIPVTAAAFPTHVTAQDAVYDFAIFTNGTAETLYLVSADAHGIYGSVTVSSLQSTSGGALSAAMPNVPTPITGLCVYNSRLWGWASMLNNNLYYSNLSTATSSVGGDSLGVAALSGGVTVVTTFGQSAIVACLTVGASLLIFHQRGISRLTGFGQSDITVSPQALAPDVGLWSRTAIDTYNGIAYFVTARGLYMASENEVVPVATPTSPDPLIPILKTLSLSRNGVIVKFNRDTSEVWVYLDGIGVYAYHTVLNAWTGPFTGVDYSTVGGLQCLAEIIDANGFPHLWAGGVGASLLSFMQCDTNGGAGYTDRSPADGSAGGSIWTSVLQCRRMFGMGIGPTIAKIWKKVKVLATLDSAILANYPTCASASVYGGTNTVTFTTPTSTEQVYTNAAGGAGPWLDVTITDASSGNGGHAGAYAQVEVEGVVVGIR